MIFGIKDSSLKVYETLYKLLRLRYLKTKFQCLVLHYLKLPKFYTMFKAFNLSEMLNFIKVMAA